jgi:hypothetical protein
VRAGALVALVFFGAAVSPCAGAGQPQPSVDAIQAAYESAKTEAQERHDDRLLIRQADCQQEQADKFSCQVGFTDERSSNGRLYFDVIGLDRERAGWKLVSGLCKR